MAVSTSAQPSPLTAPSADVWPSGGWQASIDRWLVAASMLLVLLIGAVNFGEFPIYSEDEGVYTMQAWSVLHGELSPYTYWYDHPFVGWVQLAPFVYLAQWLPIGDSFVTGVRLAPLLAMAIDTGLIYVVARRLHMRRWAAMVAVVLFALSPIVHDDMRKVFLDNIATPWVLGALALALSPRRYTWHHTAAGACLAVAVLSKETTLLLAPVIVAAIAGNAERALRRLSLTAATLAFVIVGGLYPLYAFCRGEMFPSPTKVSLTEALQWQFLDRQGSGSVFDPTSMRHYAVTRWLEHDRELIVAGVVAALLLLASRRLRPLGLSIVLPAVWVLRPDGYLPVMFIIAVTPFLALSVAGVFDVVGRTLTARLGDAARGITHRPAVITGLVGSLVLAIVAATGVAGSGEPAG